MKILITETQLNKLIEDIDMGQDIKKQFGIEDIPDVDNKIKLKRYIDFKYNRGKTITFKFNYYDTTKHPINKRILERTRIDSIREFNEIIGDNIENLWNWSGGEPGDYKFIYPEKELQVPMKIREGRRTRDGKDIDIFIPTILNSGSKNSRYDNFIPYIQKLNI